MSFNNCFYRVVASLLLVGALHGAAPAARVIFDGVPPEGILTRADRLMVTTTGTLVSRKVPPVKSQSDTYLFAVPEGPLELVVNRLQLRNTRTGELRDSLPGEPRDKAVFDAGKRQFKLDPFGQFRGVRAARLQISTARPFTDSGEQLEIAGYEAEVRWPEPGAPPASTDSAVAGGLYREMLDATLAYPPALEAFAAPDSASPHPGPTAWQPAAEGSPGMPWLRFAVKDDDLYRIDADWLRKAGVALGELTPGDIQIVREGVAVPGLALPDAKRPFADGGRLVFHASGSDSSETAEATYFLGRRPQPVPMAAMETAPPPNGDIREAVVYTRRHVAEQDNQFETRMGAFLSIREMDWLWGPLGVAKPLVTPFALPGLSDGGTTATVRLYYGEGPFPAGARLTAKIGGSQILDAEIKAARRDYEFAIPAGAVSREGNQLEFQLSAKAEPESKVLLDQIAFDYRSFPSADAGRLDFAFSPLATEVGGTTGLRAVGFSDFVLAVDVTDPAKPMLYSPEKSEGAVRIVGAMGPTTRILLRDRDAVMLAPDGRPAAATDLASRSQSADALIVYHNLFGKEATRLAESLREEGIGVKLIDVETIYNAYSYGDTSSTAIRNFLAVAVNEWAGRRPAAAILIGDSTSDGRGEARNGLPNHMPIPLMVSTQGQAKEFCSDSVYTWLRGEDQAADIILARISPSVPEEAAATVANIVRYRAAQDTPQDWAGRVVTLVDSGEFRVPVEQAFRPGLFGGYENRFVHAEDFAWEDNYYLPEHLIRRVEDSKVSPLLTAEIENAFNKGAAVVSFFGHGAPNLWSNQRFWFGGGTPNSDIPRLRNGERMPLVTSFTCNNAVVDYPLEPWNICIAEDFMRHEGKGAIGCFMPSGPGFLASHRVMAEGFSNAMSRARVRSQGVLAELTRTYYQAKQNPDDHSRMFLFLGDPFLRLPPPTGPGGDYRRERDATLSAEGGAVVIRELNAQGTPEEKKLAGLRRWALTLENQLSVPAEATLEGTLTSAEGEVVARRVLKLDIPAFETAHATMELEVPGPGAYKFRAEIPHESGAWERPRMPSRIAGEFLVVPGTERGIRIAPATFALSESTAGRQAAHLQFTIFNEGTEPASARMEGTIRRNGEPVHEFANDYRRYNTGQTALISQELPLGMEFPEPLDVEVRLRHLGDEGPGEEYARWEWRIDAGSLPDIAVVPDSVRVSPLPQADGLTVFVEAIVENRGGATSPPFSCALFKAEDIELKESLRNVTGPDAVAVEPLAPGERRAVRLRWDPSKNAGRYEIALRTDSGRVVPEPDKANNRVTIPMQVRTKSRLYIGDIAMKPGATPNEFLLSGIVGNSGETDARRVAVFFFRSPEQSNATRIGEVLLDRVPAGGTATATMKWVVDPMREDVTKLKPSFAAALKGSLMRISSIAEPEAAAP